MTLHADKHAHTHVVYTEESKQCWRRRDLAVFPQGNLLIRYQGDGIHSMQSSFSSIKLINFSIFLPYLLLLHFNLQPRLNRGGKKNVVIVGLWRMDETWKPVIRCFFRCLLRFRSAGKR